MNIAESIEEALTESSDPVSDTSRSLDGLIKRNKGQWKTEKQARFLLDRMSDRRFKDRSAEAWAKRKNLEGLRVFSMMKPIEGYGFKDPSKIRYYARVYVIDQGGVVARGRVKVLHPKKGSFGSAKMDWNQVEIDFRRPKSARPSVWVDLDTERSAQAKKNQPQIDLIKAIPGWEGKDILVSFVRQLEQGLTLSPKQKSVVQQMAPSTELFIGDKKNWEEAWEKWKRLLAKAVQIGGDKLIAADLKQDPGDDPFGGFGAPSDPEKEAEETRHQVKQAVKEIKRQGYTTTPTGNMISGGFISDTLEKLRTGVPSAGSYDEDFAEQVQKAIRAKKPSKRAIKFVTAMLRVVDSWEKMGAAGIERWAEKRMG